MPEANKSTASFGYRDVPEAEKEALVKGVFSSVARNYDLMNDLMSAGLHRVWKDLMVDMVDPRPGMAILDVAGGTGDISFRMAKRARRKGGEVDITVSDINADMLAEGEAQARRNGEAAFRWVCADAEKLPFPDNAFDIYTIAFGIRNVTHIDRALSEARRVLKPGGRFVCLEFSAVDVPMLDRIYDVYSFAVLPRLGSMVAGDAASYRYLAESIRKFPSRSKFAKMIGEAGLDRVSQRILSGGIVTLHSAWRL